MPNATVIRHHVRIASSRVRAFEPCAAGNEGSRLRSRPFLVCSYGKSRTSGVLSDDARASGARVLVHVPFTKIASGGLPQKDSAR